MVPESKKKVLLFITKSNWGGAQRYVYDVAANLDPNNFTVVVASGGTGDAAAPPGQLAEKLAEAGITFRYLPGLTRSVSLRSELLALREMWHCLRSERPDIVHLNSSKAAALGAALAWLAGVKKRVFTVHGFPYDAKRPRWQRYLITLITTITFLFATDIICICQPDLAQAKQHRFHRGKLHLIPNGISNAGPANERHLVRGQWSQDFPKLANVSPDTIWLGTGTELCERKGIYQVITAISQLPPNAPPYHLCVVGTGPLQSTLTTLAEDLGVSQHVTFLGFVTELESKLIAFDGFVLSSFKEGLPYILLELGRVGIPIIASEIDGIPDIITDQVDGQLVDPHNIPGLRDALLRLLTQTTVYQEKARILQNKIQTTFSLSRMIAETENVYLRD